MSVGSLRNFKIDGIDFELIADTDIDEKPGVMIEGVATTGNPLMKNTFQIRETSGFKIVYSKGNMDLIKALAEDNQDHDYQYTDQNGDTSYCTGRHNIESTSTMNGEITIKILPVRAWV